ncbi:MAG: MFS transporter [Deltaproteobacteria bacterium]|nr:MFS transporter [Deltaproteobacteria bacterium]MBW2067994.1 MFS transporter [Deltaproteobacteria bacterium]
MGSYHNSSIRFNNWHMILFFCCSFTMTCLLWMVLAFLPIYLSKLGIQSKMAGFIIGAYSIGGLGFIIPFGMLADRVSPKKTLFLGIFFILLHIVGIKNLTLPFWLAICAFVGGLGLSIFQIVLFALFLKVIPEDKRGIRISLYQMGFFLGFGFGPLIGAQLHHCGDYQLVLSASLVVTAILALFFSLLPDSPIYAFRWNEYRDDIVQPRALLFLIIYFIYGMHFGVEQTGFSVLMKKELGFSTREIGIVYMAVGMWMAFLSPFTGHRFDVQGRITPLLIGGLLISSVFHIATAYADNLVQMIGARILHTLGDTPAIFSMGMLTALLFPQGRMGGNSAIVYSVRTLGIFVGNFVAGIIAATEGYRGAFIYTGLFFVIASLAFWPFVHSLYANVSVASSDGVIKK